MIDKYNMKQLWEILVPTVKDAKNGKYFTTKFHKCFDEKVRKIAGGITIFIPAKGTWTSSTGYICKERVIPARIMCTEEEINQIADILQKHYQQEAVMFYLVSEKCFIKNYT